MAYTITLATLEKIVPFPGQDQRQKIIRLLPEGIRQEMFGANGDCKTSYANYVFNASFNGQNLGAKSTYEKCATLISKLSPTDVKKYLDEISKHWFEAMTSISWRANFVKALKDDADYKKITKEFRTSLTNALIQRDKKLLSQVLSALTILAVTRGVDGQWTSVSQVLYNYFPYVSSLPGNPTEDEENALLEYTKILRDRESTNWNAAQTALELVFNNENKRWRANVYEALATFWFEEFLWKKRWVFSTECIEHLQWFYTPKILSQSLPEEHLDEEHLEELIRFTALNFFMKAQSCLDGLKDQDAQMQWNQISDSYLTQLIRLYDEGRAEYLEQFRRAAEQIAEKPQALRKSWYGEACRKIAEACLKKKDESNFTEYLKLSRELKDDEFTQYLALRVLSPLESDPCKEFFAKIRKKLLWKAHYLAIDLKESENLKICGKANWRLYVESGRKNRDFLHKAWRCGFPREAVQEWDETVVSYCKTLEHATSCDEATCWINVDSSHFIARIFSSTCPEKFEVSCKAALNESTFKENFRGERLIALLIDDNAEKNLSDFLQLLEYLKKNHSATFVTIFVRGSEDLLTPIIDTALQQYFNHKNDGNYPIIRVEIIDEIRDAARQLLARHPVFFTIRQKKAYQVKTLRFITVGDGQLAKELVKEAAWLMMSLNKNLNINPKITLLTPLGRSLNNEIRAINSELAAIIEEKNVLLPGFIAPDNSSSVQTLPEVIEEFVNAGDSLYFACAISQYNLNNLSLAITIREILLRSWLKYSKEIKPPATPVAFYCQNEDINFLSARTIVLGEEYGSTPNFANSYNLIPFGNRMRFSFHNLCQNIFSRLALAVHLNYCGISSKEEFSFSEEDCLASYKSYARKTYNRQSSLSVAMSLPYRIFAYEQLTGKTVFNESWDITDETEIFSEDNLNLLAEKFKKIFNASETQELCRWEHDRWCKYLILSENWSPSTLEDAKKFIVAGNLRQQLFVAKVHPCLSRWSKLDEISKVISQTLRNNGLDLKADKNFKKSDETSILSTSEIMTEIILQKSDLLKKLFLVDLQTTN